VQTQNTGTRAITFTIRNVIKRVESQIEGKRKKNERYARENKMKDGYGVKATAIAIVVAKGEFLKVKWVTIAKSL